jgi:signal transduction histidine kinase
MFPSNLKVLAIDDNRDNLITLQAVLSDAIPGIRVITETDGKLAKDLALEYNPDVILLDIVMPGIDGLTVCRMLKEDPLLRHIPVIMLTALRTDRSTRLRAVEAGAEAFLAKPIDEFELQTQIRAMARIKESNDIQRFEKTELSRLVDERTRAIENELAERKKAEEELKRANLKLREMQSATLNLLEDLRLEIVTREKTESDLRVAISKAEESDRLKSAFLANMSHEIRTPMNGIIGFSELLKDPDVEEQDRNKFIRIINENCDQLLHIINDIIDISKIEAGLVELEPVEFCLNEMLDSLYEMYLSKARMKNLVLNLDKGLVCDACSILADQSKLRQVIENLLTNALKFTPQGNIEFGYTLESSRLMFFVKDTGIGILPEHREAIFDRFWQVENGLARKFGGNGLGLSISNAFVTKMGGRIEVESYPGRGSSFTFSIPYVRRGNKASSQAREPLQNPRFYGKKVLVVEDEPDNFNLIEIILGKMDLKILHAWDGAEALNLFRSEDKIDLILMDFKLPDIPGQEVTRRILEINNEVPVIATTAYAMHGDRERALEAGCCGYVSKPIRLEEISQVISRFLG